MELASWNGSLAGPAQLGKTPDRLSGVFCCPGAFTRPEGVEVPVNLSELFEKIAADDSRTVRMVAPEEYRKFHFPDYPTVKGGLSGLVRHFKKTDPDYYAKIKDDVQKNGFTTPILVQYKDPAGRPLAKPYVREGHHRAAVAHELGLHLPVGDYDNEADFQYSRAGNAEWFKNNERGPQGMSWNASLRTAAEDAGVYRGMSIVLPPEIHAMVHDPQQPAAARAHLLLSEIRKQKEEHQGEEATGQTGGLGSFWTPSRAKAEEYATQSGFQTYREHENEHRCGDEDYGEGGCPTTRVIVHAQTPPEKHHWTEVFRPGEKYDPEISWRLPVRPGTPMRVRGISWREGHDNQPSSVRYSEEGMRAEKSTPYESHDFLREVRKSAGVSFGPGTQMGESEYDPDETWDHKPLWDQWHPKLNPEVHRHIALDLPGNHPAHNEDLPLAERARAVLAETVKRGNVGTHWTDDPDYDHLSTGNGRVRPGQTRVVLHAKTPPRSHIEDADWVLEQRGVRDWDWDPEREVPMKRNAPLEVQGITWHTAKGPVRHDFGHPIRVHAASVSPEEYARRDGESGYDHDDRIRHGLSMGHLTLDQAKEHGYRPNNREDNRDSWSGESTGKGWQPLPKELWHTTTDAAGVMAHGLKSAQELGHRNGHGLGGTPQWLSLTDREDHAHNMLDALHEYHDHLNGKTTFADLYKAAQNGEGAQQPFHEGFLSAFGDEPPAAREARMQGKRIEPGWSAHEDAEAKGWEPHPEFHQNFGKGKDGRTYGSGWLRDATLDERHEEYGAFSRARHWSGKGKPSILFVSNDRKAFAEKDPKNFAVLKVRPKPGAQGFPMEGEHEWRTGTGQAVEVDGEPIRRQAARRIAAGQQPISVDLDAMDSASKPYTQNHEWLPSGRYWGPNSAQNDQRLFEGDHLRPEVREDLLRILDSFMRPRYREWPSWTKAYFAGSQAARWLDESGRGNGDFDMLIGIDFDKFRQHNPEYAGEDDESIAKMLTDGMHRSINDDEYHPPV